MNSEDLKLSWIIYDKVFTGDPLKCKEYLFIEEIWGILGRPVMRGLNTRYPDNDINLWHIAKFVSTITDLSKLFIGGFEKYSFNEVVECITNSIIHEK